MGKSNLLRAFLWPVWGGRKLHLIPPIEAEVSIFFACLCRSQWQVKFYPWTCSNFSHFAGWSDKFQLHRVEQERRSAKVRDVTRACNVYDVIVSTGDVTAASGVRHVDAQVERPDVEERNITEGRLQGSIKSSIWCIFFQIIVVFLTHYF